MQLSCNMSADPITYKIIIGQDIQLARGLRSSLDGFTVNE